jgi:hypothetical protein
MIVLTAGHIMNIVGRRASVVVLLALSVACGTSGPISPTGTNGPVAAPPAPTPRPPTDFPPLSGPSRTFTFDRALLYPVRDYTSNSRFVLYDNGAFVLQYSGGAYRGSYSETNGVIAFDWEGWSTAGPWAATGTLTGDSLTIQYNFIMQMTDFEDAVYRMRI